MTQTVLVTGATGYIAKHLVLQLLNGGYSVVGSARSTAREKELRTALTPHLTDPTALDRLRLVVLDLNSDDGWDAAMQGIDVVMHTASPFPMTMPQNEQDIIRPAVEGALRAVKAAKAAGITRVIMTSSVVAIANSERPEGRDTHNESDWSELTGPSATAYLKSKTLAERAVWDWQSADAPDMQITMINPSFVQGAPLDNNFGTSIEVIDRLMRGKDPMVPDIGFPCVDVRDIALMHIRAMETSDSIGKRFIGVDRYLTFAEIAGLLKADHPSYKIPTRVAPHFLIRVMALFDKTIRSIVPMLGKHETVSGARAQSLLGMEFRDVRLAVRDSGAYLVDNNLL
ncbi:MAG: NAD-dependent epimerase/dehydratase family protein [Rhodobacteraceae bacterium]|nr:NAD-dependent epimerase/dehydratase family protein [Paracoccaceae bacterium]